MLKRKKILSLLFLSLLAVTGCKDETPEPAPTKTQLLTSSSWIVTSATVNPWSFDIGGTDFFAQFEDCTKDDLVTYNTNGTVVRDEGASKCYSEGPQSTTGSWRFDANETKIIEDDESLTIEELSADRLSLSLFFNGEDIGGVTGLKYKYTLTYKHP